MSMSYPIKKHDVFLSFRGEDTRMGFTDHLNDALDQKSIKTYIDYLIVRGENVWPSLAKAIEESHISIIVFSENYASSTWCLDELVKILECRRQVYGQVVIPVFYNTYPSDIRYQSGSYEKAFAKHERDPRNYEKVLIWKAALNEAANISGWDSHTHKGEANLIQKIVNDVMQKLQLKYPNELEGIVRTEKNCQVVESLVTSVPTLGIWGMGGVGKTTIAKVLFAKLFAQYDHVCFANAKDYSVSKLLSELLKEEISPANAVGSTFHMRRLRSKKVFIIVDNVDSLDQFEYLCRNYGDLSNDSRLIITTRNRQLLRERVDLIYEVKQWEDLESLKLFSLEAFKQTHPIKGYKDLSHRAVAYAGGIPLALKVLGSNLRSKSTKFWVSTFQKLDKFPKEEIQKVLKVSYDGLDPLEKKIFLDIAFFFKGEEKDRVIRILDACGFEARCGIEVLEDKALITISNGNRIQMHDLLKKMASDIILKDCGINPATHTRLSGSEALKVIKENKGTNSIEGITLDLSQNDDFPLRADTFTKMKALRILKFYIPLGQSCSTSNAYINHPIVLEQFSSELRYFEWIGYPFQALPQTFCAKFLVEIHMPNSNVKWLWQGMQELEKLEGINLSECRHFVQLPDLSKASRLKWVDLSGCVSLVDLHPSVFFAETLTTLILDRCTKLRTVKSHKHLKNLENISISGCTSLEEFAVSSDLIENLDLSSTGIQTLDQSIGRLQELKQLNLESLRLNHLPKELSSVRSIKELKISGSRLKVEKQQLHELFDGLRSLQILHMKDFRNPFELPNNVHVVAKLMELNLDGSNMKRLPESIKLLQSLEILSLVNCRELECLPELPPLIKLLYVDNCMSLVSVSNLKTLAAKMMGNTKHISFSNNLNLDGHSLRLIMESFNLTMVSAVFQNVSVRRHQVDIGYNYTSVDACLPGGSIPSQFKCQTTIESSITIKQLPDHSNLLGFIYSVILSPTGGNGMKKGGAKIECRCNLGQAGKKATWLRLNIDVTDLNRDHIFVWYDPFHCDSILKFYERSKICFEFCVTNDTGKVDDSVYIKECGVRLVSVEELESVLPQLDLDLDKKMDLKRGVEMESGRTINLTSIEASDETNQIHNQQGGISKNSPIDKKDVTDSNSAVVKLESVEEDNESESHIFNVEEKSMGSTSKETNSNGGTSHQENVTNSTKVRDGSSGDDESNPSISPTRLNVTDELQEAPNKLNPNSPMASQSSSSKPSSKGRIRETDDASSKLKKSSTPEYSPVNYSEYKRILDEDPLAIMEKLLSDELSRSSQTSQSTTQAEATETQRESIEMLLDELRELAFSRNLLKHLPNDVTLGEKVKALLLKLNHRADELSEKQSSAIAKFTTIFTDATINIDEEKVINDTLQQLKVDRKDSISKLQAYKKKIMEFEESITAGENKIKDIYVQIEDIKAHIRLLEEEAHKVQQEKSQLDLKCKEKRTEIVEETKNVASKTIQICEKIDRLEKKKSELDSNYEMLEEQYAKMRLSPLFRNIMHFSKL